MSRRRRLLIASAIGGALGLLIGYLAVELWDRANPDPVVELQVIDPTPSSTTTTATTVPPTTTTTRPPATSTTTTTAVIRLIPKAEHPPPADGRFRSTAYCLTGKMASGRPTYVGAVAGNRWPIGTVLTAWPNPWGNPDMEFTVEDRHQEADANGYPTQIDFAMPSECKRALRWGNRTFVTVTVIGGEL